MKQLNKYINLLFIVVSLTVAATQASPEARPAVGVSANDVAITNQVKEAILKEPTLKTAEIKIETVQGTVQLSGFLNSQSDISTAMKMAYDVAGVKSVKNDMRLKSTM